MRLKGERNLAAFFDIADGYAEEVAGIWSAWMKNPTKRLQYNNKFLRAVAEPSPEHAFRQRIMGAAQDWARSRLADNAECKMQWGGTFKGFTRFIGEDDNAWRLVFHVLPSGALQWGSPPALAHHLRLSSEENAQRSFAEFQR